MQFTYIVGNHAFTRSLAYAAKELDRIFKGKVTLEYFLYFRRHPMTAEQVKRLEESIKRADVILTSMVFEGQPIELIRKFGQNKTVIIHSGTPQALSLTRLGKFNFGEFLESVKDSKIAKAIGFLQRIISSGETRREYRTLLERLDTVLKVLKFGKWKDAGNYLKTMKYSTSGGDENYLNMFLFIIREYFGYDVTYKEPQIRPAEFIFHPESSSCFYSVKDYLAWYKSYFRKNDGKLHLVGLLKNHDEVIANDIADVTKLIEELEGRGVGVIPVSCGATQAFKTMRAFFIDDKRCLIDVMTSFLNFRLEGGPLGGDYEACLKFCEKMNVPLIKLLTLGLTSFEE